MSRGPDIQKPANCTSIELKDLADLLEFESRGESGAVYGLELTDVGLYKRKAIEASTPRFPKLSEIRDIDIADVKENLDYRLYYEDKKWMLTPVLQINWDIIFEFCSPFTFMTKQRLYRKSINSGHVHVALSPDHKSGGKIHVVYQNDLYFLHSTDQTKRDIVLDFVSNISLQNTFTMVFDVVLLPSLDNISTNVMGGVNFSWKALNGKTRALVLILKNAEGISATTNDPKLTVTTDKAQFKSLDKIMITHLDLISFHYNQSVIAGDKLELFKNKKLN